MNALAFAQLRAVGDGLTEHVPRRDVREIEVLADALRLRPLPGAGRAEEDEVELAHRRYFRKPS
jgi:hypothetical protein